MMVHLLSYPRLIPYLKQAKGGEEDRAIKIYQLYLPVQGMLVGILGTVEICLRNSIDMCLIAHLGKDWINNKIWVTKKGTDRGLKEARELDRKGVENSDKSRPRSPPYDRQRGEPTHADRITRITFGFWRNLFVKKYYIKHLWKKGTIPPL